MIAPVADVAPGVVGFRHLPIDAVAGDAIGVEPVGRRGVDEHRDHAGEILREAHAERLPVLEDIPPVPFVVQNRFSGCVAHADREGVPGAARVPVTPGETERQVFETEPYQLWIAVAADVIEEHLSIDDLGQRLQPGPVPAGNAPVAVEQESCEVGSADLVAGERDTAAHHVVRDVGELVGGSDTVAGPLQCVGRCHDPVERLGSASQGRDNRGRKLRRRSGAGCATSRRRSDPGRRRTRYARTIRRPGAGRSVPRSR